MYTYLSHLFQLYTTAIRHRIILDILRHYVLPISHKYIKLFKYYNKTKKGMIL